MVLYFRAELCITNLNAQKQLNGFTCDPSPDQNLATPPKPGMFV